MSTSDVIEKFSEPLNKLLVPVATSAGTTLQDAWELVFGGFSNYVEKKRLIRAKSLMAFKTSLENHVSAIPEDCLCEPPLSIVGPALEASKYYFEEPELREMFAKLISAAMNSRTAQSVHPSFTEIIKQMSPLDAQNLSLFEHALPIAEYRLETEGGGYYLLASNIFLSNPSITDLDLQAQSLSSLERLGLIHIDYESFLTDESEYVDFDQTDMFLELKYSMETQSKYKGNMMFQKGKASVTPLGRKFRNICLIDINL